MRDVHLDQSTPPGTPPATSRLTVAHRLSHALRAAGADLLHALLPSNCRLCDAPVLSAHAVRVCDACVQAACPPRDSTPICTRCGVSLGLESSRLAAAQGITDCTLCRMAPPAFDRAVSAAGYTDQLRELLRQLKYENARALAQSILGQHLAAAIATLPLSNTNLLLVPVPLFAARHRERGYNQAALLATAALSQLRRTHPSWKLTLAPHLLDRVKDTRAMHTLQPHHRRAGLQDAFRSRHRQQLAGRDVLLIDDIMTTGATARECARVLRAAGAAHIWVATVARAQPDFPAASSSTARWTQTSTPPATTIHPRTERQRKFN